MLTSRMQHSTPLLQIQCPAAPCTGPRRSSPAVPRAVLRKSSNVPELSAVIRGQQLAIIASSRRQTSRRRVTLVCNAASTDTAGKICVRNGQEQHITVISISLHCLDIICLFRIRKRGPHASYASSLIRGICQSTCSNGRCRGTLLF